MNALEKLEYVSADAQEAVSRFGSLRTSAGTYKMPCICPAIRTRCDALAVLANVDQGIIPGVISIHASYVDKVVAVMGGYLGGGEEAIRLERPLVILDPESEALSSDCIARRNFQAMGDIPQSVDILMTAGLRGGGKYNRPKAISAWRQVKKDYTLSGVKDYYARLHMAARADVFLAPTPIVRNDLNELTDAFEFGYNILDEAIADGEFPMYGIHLLLHSELFNDKDASIAARNEIYKEVDTWSGSKERFAGKVFSFKVFDTSDKLTEVEKGGVRRQNLSEFIMEISARVRKAGGAVVGHNFSTLSLGVLDSGADISSFRVSGGMKIDMPILKKKGQSSGPKPVPAIYDYTRLTEVPMETIKVSYSENKAYPVPAGITPEPYWEWDNNDRKKIYTNRVKVASFLELGKEYREAGLNKEIPIGEAIRNRILQCEERQALIDMCPSMSAL